MSGYSSHPAGPFEHIDAVMHVRSTYGIPARDVADMLIAATQSPSGMASLPVPASRRKVWATHMTTQGGRYIIEVEQAPLARPAVPPRTSQGALARARPGASRSVAVRPVRRQPHALDSSQAMPYCGAMALQDDIVTQLVQARSDDTAWGIVSGRPRATLEAVADLLYVDPYGMGTHALRKAIVREARA